MRCLNEARMIAFILLFGTRPVKSEVRDGRREVRDCPNCGLLSEMREYRIRNFFTFFFIPIFPLGRGQEVMSCSRCGSSYDPRQVFSSSSSHSAPDAQVQIDEEMTVIACNYCGGKLRVPKRAGHRMLVTCTHCERKFELRL